MAQAALDRWWWPSLMMFGPSDNDSKHSAQSMRWKIKRFSNDELRQKFVDTTVPQADYLGLKVPDPELRWDDTAQHYRFGPIDWREFEQVLQGQGPCNRERLEARRRAHEDGALGARSRDGLGGKAGGAQAAARPERRGPSMSNDAKQDWPLYEIFIRAKSGLDHKHVGSLHATDARMALEHARDLYTRRQEGVSIWAVRSADIVASDPADADAFFEPARDKVYRHPTFYDIPDEVKTL